MLLEELGNGATKMRGNKPSSKLGEVPLHGSRRHGLGPQNFGLRD